MKCFVLLLLSFFLYSCSTLKNKKVEYSPLEFTNKVRKLNLGAQLELKKIDFLVGERKDKLINSYINVEEAPFTLNQHLLKEIKKIKTNKTDNNEEMLKRLIELVFRKPSDLNYDFTYTLNALSCYELRSCNCFGITNLMLGVARAAGIKSHYVLVEDSINTDYKKNNLVYSNHIACELDFNNNCFVVDVDQIRRKYKIEEILTDIEAAGLFYCNIATKYLNHGQYNQALEIFEIAEKMYPDSYQLHNNLGVLYLKIKEFDLALEQFKIGIKQSKYPELFLNNFRIVSSKMGKSKLYLDALGELQRIKNRNPIYLISKKIIPLIESGCFKNALFYLSKAEEVGKRTPSVYLYKAYCYRKLGNVGMESKMLNKAKSIWGTEKYNEMEKLYYRMSDNKKINSRTGIK